MHSLKQKTLVSAIFAASMLPLTASAAFLNNWTFDITGSGNTTANVADDGVTFVNEYLDIIGVSYVDLDLANPNPNGSVPFQDVGTFNTVGADAGANAFDNFKASTLYESTFKFELSGDVSLPGNIDFNAYTAGDYVEWWVGSSATATKDYGSTTGIFGADNGTLIGKFQLNFGTGTVGITGVPNGLITIILEPTTLLAGYFFDTNGVDLSTLVDGVTGNGPLFGFVTTNASLNDAVNATVNSEIVQQLAGDASLTPNPDGITYGSDAPDRFVVGNNGQYRWSVPEPGMIALLGMGLLGMGITGRRRNRA
ncbi:PEP-CTERM sorting domain-containing protein [Thiobacillus sp.]